MATIHKYFQFESNFEKFPLGTDEKNNITEKILDCADLYQRGYNESGIYVIWPIMRYSSKKQIYVYCDMHTDGGGWTVSTQLFLNHKTFIF